jgi:tetratricopeptide (TPR) repeat protein
MKTNISSLKHRLGKKAWEAAKRSVIVTLPVPNEALDRARSLFQAGAFEEVLPVLEQEPNLRTDPTALTVCGLAAHALGQHTQALEFIEDATLLNYMRLCGDEVNRAAILLDLEAFDQAADAAERATALYPYWHLPHVARFAVYAKTQQWPKLDVALAEMMQLWPEWSSDPELLHHLRNDPDMAEVIRRPLLQAARTERGLNASQQATVKSSP